MRVPLRLDRRTVVALVVVGGAIALSWAAIGGSLLLFLLVEAPCEAMADSICGLDHSGWRDYGERVVELHERAFPEEFVGGLFVVRDPHGFSGNAFTRRCFDPVKVFGDRVWARSDYRNEQRAVFAVNARVRGLDFGSPRQWLEVVFELEDGAATEVWVRLFETHVFEDEPILEFDGVIELDDLRPEPGERVRCAFTLHDGSPERVWCVNGEVELTW